MGYNDELWVSIHVPTNIYTHFTYKQRPRRVRHYGMSIKPDILYLQYPVLSPNIHPNRKRESSKQPSFSLHVRDCGLGMHLFCAAPLLKISILFIDNYDKMLKISFPSIIFRVLWYLFLCGYLKPTLKHASIKQVHSQQCGVHFK